MSRSHRFPRLARILTCSIGLALAGPQLVWADTAQFEIKAEPLSAALKDFAQQAHMQLLYEYAIVRNVRGNPVAGLMEKHAALEELLRNTGLEAVFSSDDAATIRPIQVSTPSSAQKPSATGGEGEPKEVSKDSRDASRKGQSDNGPTEPPAEGPPESGPQPDTSSGPQSKGQKQEAIQEVVVTGTHIRGETTSISPVISFDQAQIEQSGFSTTDDFIRSLPQNFAGGEAGASPDGILGSGEDASNNYSAASSVNLRGLGANDTLVLLNGRRMAPSDFGSVVDISLIPLAAVSHIDIVTDGASAIYGADAVGGVANFVMRQDYQGAETTVRYGSVTDGGQREELVNQLGGTNWGSGGGLVDFQYRHEGALATSERPFTEDVLSPSDILPDTDRYSGLLSAHQSFLPNLEAFVQTLAVDSLVSRDETLTTVHSTSQTTRNTAVNATTGVDYFPFGDWRAELSGTFSRQALNVTYPRYTNPTAGYKPGEEYLNDSDRYESGDLEMDGSLLALPGGELKAAFGGTWRDEQFLSVEPFLPLGTTNRVVLIERHVGAEYAELNIPIVGARNSRLLLRQVRVSLAVRHDDYSDFGGTTNGKYGVLWSPDRTLTFRASYDTSFRPPDPQELLYRALGQTALSYYLTAPNGQGTVPALLLTGTSPNLGPETSRQWTGGLVYQPVPGARISIDYYDIDFTNRIITPSVDLDALQKPGIYGSLITPISSATAAAYVANLIAQGGTFDDLTGHGTSDVQYFYDLETQNAAVVRQSGWDLEAAYLFGADPNRFRVDLNTAFIDRIDTQFSPTSVPTDLVNTYGNPLRLRMRGELGWFHGNLTVSVAENFSNAYTDTTSTPYGTIGSWITTDLVVQYALSQVRGLSVQLSATNLLNRYPPYVAAGVPFPAVHYDVGNADPQGRFLALTVRKDW